MKRVLNNNNKKENKTKYKQTNIDVYNTQEYFRAKQRKRYKKMTKYIQTMNIWNIIATQKERRRREKEVEVKEANV